MFNDEIRKRIECNRLRYWQVAAAIGISPECFSRWLRSPLTGDRLDRVNAAIDKLLHEREGLEV